MKRSGYVVVFALCALLPHPMVSAGAQAFAAASIRPGTAGHGWYINSLPGGRLRAENVPLAHLILYAYRIRPDQVQGMPNWARDRMYTVAAVAPPEVAQLSGDALRQAQAAMMQDLLQQRFGLREHWSQHEADAYDLVIAKGGPKMQPAADDDPGLPSTNPGGPRPSMVTGRGWVHASGAGMAGLAAALTGAAGRPVVDKSQLAGRYTFSLQWADSPDQAGESLFTALSEQLGLKLVPSKTIVKLLVVDSVSPPTPN